MSDPVVAGAYLEEIRSRVEASAEAVAFSRLCDHEKDGGWRAIVDRADLLAEVDRLRTTIIGAPGDSEPPRNELEAMVMERRAAGVGAPEGQRIEGYAWRNGERGLGGEVWQFSRYHSLLPKPDPRATLIIHAEPVAPADGREGEES